MGLWPRLEQWTADWAFAERPSLPFKTAARESLVWRQRLNAFGAGGLALLWVAANGVPALSGSVILILLGAPASLWLVPARHAPAALPAASILTFLAAGIAASLSRGTWHETSFLWFALASLDGAFSGSRAHAAASAISAGVAAFAATICSKPITLPSPDSAGLAPLLTPALLLALNVATGCSHLRTLRRGAHKALAEIWDDFALTADCLALRCGLSGQVSAVSPNCERLLGLTPGALMGCGFFGRVQVADRPAFLKALADAGAGGAGASAELRWRGPERAASEGRASPAFLWLEMRARRAKGIPLAAQENGDGDVIVFVRDVTEAKCRAAELENAHAELREAQAEKELFYALASHEIRAPLNAIAGFSELLACPGAFLSGPEKEREYARIIHQSSQHLLSVVNAMTEMQLIAAGKLELSLERFEASPQIDLCCDMVGLAAQANGVTLRRVYGPDLGAILCDRRLFTQILANLLSNAVKFTPSSGRVTLSAHREPDALLLKVADTGNGIDPEDLTRLGDPFFRAKNASAGQEKGTGLGLAIVRGFVGLLGGDITVASEKGKGTCVSVRLPRACNATAAGAKRPARIATLCCLPLSDELAPNWQTMVKKIA